MIRAACVVLVLVAASQAAISRDGTIQSCRVVDFGPLDPVALDKRHYSVELDNEHVRVVRVRYSARERGMLHEHRCGRVTVFLTPLHQTLRRPNGEMTESRASAGEVKWGTADRHSDENLADAPIELVYVDVKSACGS